MILTCQKNWTKLKLVVSANVLYKWNYSKAAGLNTLRKAWKLNITFKRQMVGYIMMLETRLETNGQPPLIQRQHSPSKIPQPLQTTLLLSSHDVAWTDDGWHWLGTWDTVGREKWLRYGETAMVKMRLVFSFSIISSLFGVLCVLWVVMQEPGIVCRWMRKRQRHALHGPKLCRAAPSVANHNFGV